MTTSKEHSSSNYIHLVNEDSVPNNQDNFSSEETQTFSESVSKLETICKKIPFKHIPTVIGMFSISSLGSLTSAGIATGLGFAIGGPAGATVGYQIGNIGGYIGGAVFGSKIGKLTSDYIASQLSGNDK